MPHYLSDWKRKISILLFYSIHTAAAQQWHIQPTPLQTPWAKDVTPQNTLQEYPRPQLRRPAWQNLNGLWEFSITDSASHEPGPFEGKILVPYPVESALSGVKKALMPDQRLWYRRNLTLASKIPRRRYLLHFGAIDFEAVVSVNNKEVGRHTGGFQAFEFDITDALKKGDNTILVSVLDPTESGNNPKGKQVLHPKGMMYTAVSGIWQTVWMEIVPETYITSLNITPDIDKQQVQLNIRLNRAEKGDKIQVSAGRTVVATEIKNNQYINIILPVDSVHCWSPDDPFLYDMTIRILRASKTLDQIESYFGMRKIEIRKDSLGQERIMLNHKWTYNLGVLDQGYWPDGLYTAPTDSALSWDIQAIKNMGFNTIRKHIKIEPARFYYHCDKLGMLIWQDMPVPANRSPEAREEFEQENAENIRLLYNSPSIVCWVLFNEGWNAYDQKRLTEWMKAKDPSRLVNGHTGENYCQDCPQKTQDKWHSSDLTDVHIYPGPDIAPALAGKARSLGEWGGVRVSIPGHQWDSSGAWGYIQASPQQFGRIYGFMARHLRIYREQGLSASIYTEPFDVESEENGLITYDRKIFKIPVNEIRKINESILKPSDDF